LIMGHQHDRVGEGDREGDNLVRPPSPVFLPSKGGHDGKPTDNPTGAPPRVAPKARPLT
jgi:hypothetical protein